MPLLDLGWRGEEPFQVDADLVATGRTCVVGASGSGKSYAVGVICEELCKNKVPLALIDVEGEYSGLKERYELIWVSEGRGCDVSWSSLNVEELARQAPDIPPLILDISEVDEPRAKVERFLIDIYREISSRRTPYLIILEEADKFVPQVGEKLQILQEIARRGRKRGLGLLLCTQRPSLVDKNVLSQCSNQLIGRLVIRNDLQSVSQFFQEHGLPKQLTTLPPGVFYALGGLSPLPVSIRVRVRETTHGGITPKLKDRVVKPSMVFLERLRVPEAIQRSFGLPPLIDSRRASTLARKGRLVLFGRREEIAGVQLIFWPLIELVVRIRAGLIRRRFEDRYLFLDGVTGRQAEFKAGLSFKYGLEKVLGVDTQSIEFLKTLKPDRDISLMEVSDKLGVSEGLLRNMIKLLDERKLIASRKSGRAKVYRRLIELPKLRLLQEPIELEQVNTSDARVEEVKIREAEVREVLRGLVPNSDLASFRVFFYPLYKVELLDNKRKRAVWIDARKGKELR